MSGSGDKKLIHKYIKQGKKSVTNIDFTAASFETMKKFNISDQKRQQLLNFMMEKVAHTKVKEYKTEIDPEYPKIAKKNTAHEQMRRHADELPTTGISKYVVRDIMKRTDMKKQCDAFPETLRSVALEFKREYIDICHGTGVNSRVRPLDGSEAHTKLEPYQFLGKTSNYNTFLENRNRLSHRLYISWPLIRKLLDYSVKTLPDVLVDFSNYRNKDNELPDLEDLLLDEITAAVLQLKTYYNKIARIVNTHKYNLPPKGTHDTSQHYFKTGTRLLATCLSRLLRRSIEHLVEVTGDPERVPFLKLNLAFQRKLILYPAYEDTIQMYLNLITAISNAGNELLTVEAIVSDLDNDFIPIYIDNDFIKQAYDQIQINISAMYDPILKYVESLDVKFQAIFPKHDFTTDITYEIGIAEITSYLKFMDSIGNILSDEYYAIGQLEQEECKNNLKESIFNVIDDIAMKLIHQHEWDNHDISEAFEMLAVRALTDPLTSDELMEQGVYMTWANTELMTELTERIKKLLVCIGNLMEITTITKEHMDLTSSTVNWIWKIKPILEQNSFKYETFKFNFEERLAKAVERLNGEIRDLVPYLSLLDEMDDSDHSREYVHMLADILVKIRSCDKQKAWINKEEATFKFPISAFNELQELKDYIYPFYHLIKLTMNWNRSYNAWLDGPFEFLDPVKAEEQTEEYLKELQKTQKAYRNKLRQLAAENYPRRFRGAIDDPDPVNLPAPLKLCSKVIQKIKDFRPDLTLMRIMCNTALLQRHWDEMSEIAGFDMTPNAGTTLKKISCMDLGPNIDNYEIISSGAIKELQLITNLNKMISEWDDIKFKTSPYKETGIYILTALDDVQAILEDHIMKTLTMRGSVFVKPYEAQVKAWYEKITRINQTIDIWGKVQAQWLYLLPIFSSKDIIAQMPTEGILFKEVDGTYKRYMQVVHKDPRVIETAGAVGLLEALEVCMENLEKINDGVTAYLEKKRLFFPRFFFLSNDEMLEILSETKDPLRVQPHLRKCFEAINKLEFDSSLAIHAMYSQETEKVDFLRIVSTEEASGSVEKWLIQVEEQMITAIRNEIFQSWLHYVTVPRTEWVQNWPGQVVLAVSQIYWTAAVHNALGVQKDYSLESYSDKLVLELQEIVALVRDPDITNLARITIKALIVIDVHAKDVVHDLVAKQVANDNEFKWLAQLRYYWEQNECQVRMLNATVKYAYEYLGNSDRLVITPLTDRCYRTLIGAYHLHLNGAPEGPAGTGKTETTKDLAKALAVQCVVFNCSDGLDYKAMGKFFKGLASAGAWACFDEFNRIEIEVLSVVAQQILCIVLAVRAALKKFMFEGTELTLNPTCYVCITMNPGYAGRSELPDNLKVLFRTVAMMVPDYAMIGEISLYSYGFIQARKLSVKIVTTYKLCSEQLSSQNHYDYGMRAVKSVLSACGNNKRNFPNEDEDILLLRSIIDINLAKFLNHDVPLFEGIISDLFPGVVLPQPDYQLFIETVQSSCKQRNLQPRQSFITKIIQTYEMMIVRHGFMLVGEPFAGKTSTLKVLADTLTMLNEAGLPQLKVQYTIINPKSITMGQLYGQFDPVSYEWFDGVVATTFRNFVMDQAPDRKWVVFDGPVDAVWIENMNTVLDDNKKLCLMSGEVMAMTNSMSMIFEVMDLAQASPATVSRCGMIYMEPATLGWRPFTESWIINQNPEWCGPEHSPLVTDLFDWLVDPCLYFIRRYCKQLCYPGDINLVKNMYQLVEMILNDACEHSTKKEEDFKFIIGWIQATFIFAGLWGLGAILDHTSREKFDEFYKDLWKGINEKHPYPASMEKLEITLPFDGLLIDHIYIYKLKGTWKYWPDIVKSMKVEDCPNIQQVLIPTIDSVKYVHLIEMHIKHKKPFLFIGPTGTGKSFYIQDYMMNKLEQDLFEPAFITFTVKISANQTQDLVISKLVKKRRGGNVMTWKYFQK